MPDFIKQNQAFIPENRKKARKDITQIPFLLLNLECLIFAAGFLESLSFA